jgi:hypothetical protein
VLKRGDVVRLISRKEIEEAHARLRATRGLPFTAPAIPIGAIGTIREDEDETGIANCRFDLGSIFVNSAMVAPLDALPE